MGLISTLSTQTRQNMHGPKDLKRRCYKQICLRVFSFFFLYTMKLGLLDAVQRYKEDPKKQAVPKYTESEFEFTQYDP